MMRVLFLALALLAANSITYVALAQDAPSPQAGEGKEGVHRVAHPTRPRAVRDLQVAAIQAPAPLPRPRPAAAAGVPQSQASANPVQVLQKFTLTDLQAALADANAQTPPDTIAANCYTELITVVQSPAINPLPSGPGAFQLFQKARDLKALADSLQSRNGPLTALNIACAPLVMDVQTLLIRLGVIGGAIAGGLPPL